MKTITLGRYYNISSFFHKLDPRTKILCLILFIVSLFILNSPCMFALSAVLLIYCIIASGLKLSHVFKPIIKLLFTFGVLSFIVWLSTKDLSKTAITFFRLVLIVLSSSVLTYTTKPSEIANGLNAFFHNTDISMIICIALRYLPILAGKAQDIYQSQKLRGADYSNKTLIQKAKLSLSVIVPMFASSFRMASNLGIAMDARLYNSKRTSLNQLKFTGYDLTFILVFVAYVAAVVGVRYVC